MTLPGCGDVNWVHVLGLRTLCLIFLTLFYSEFLTISSIVLLLISIMLAMILTFPIIMLHTCKFSHSRMTKKLHDPTKHKVGMLKLVTVYAHQRVLMVVVVLPL